MKSSSMFDTEPTLRSRYLTALTPPYQTRVVSCMFAWETSRQPSWAGHGLTSMKWIGLQVQRLADLHIGNSLAQVFSHTISLLLYRILYSNYLIIKSYSMQVNLHIVVYDFAYKIIHEISCQWELAGRCNDPRINLTVKLSNPDLCTGTQSQKQIWQNPSHFDSCNWQEIRVI